MSATDEEREQLLLSRRCEDSPGVREARLRKSVGTWGRWWGNWYYVPLVIGLGAIPMCRLSAGLGQKDRSVAALGVVIVLGLVMVALLGSLIATFFAMRRDVQRWAASIAELPFEVIDLRECLGDRPDANRPHLALLFVFGDKAPKPDELAQLLLAGDGGWTTDRKGTLATLRPGRGDLAGRDNRQVAAWFRGLAEVELRAIHARFPIKSVRVLNALSIE